VDEVVENSPEEEQRILDIYDLPLSMGLILMQVISKIYLLFLIKLHWKALKPSVSFVSKIPMSIHGKPSSWRACYIENKGILRANKALLGGGSTKQQSRDFLPSVGNFLGFVYISCYKKPRATPLYS